jgi:hypothetical protein
MDNLSQGFGIVAAGITTVFVNLAVIMMVLMVLGKLFGKKSKAASPAKGAPAKDAGAAAPR